MKVEEKGNTSGWGDYVSMSDFVDEDELCHEFGGSFAFEFVLTGLN
jgi:hypothetical protein